MFLNIVTPCTRIYNLPEISRSITQIPRENYHWWVIVDSLEPVAIPARNAYEIPDEVIFFHDDKSINGNAQRNAAIERISGGHVYFLDDDTIMHPDFWNELKNYDQYDFIHFNQVDKTGRRRIGGSVAVNCIDSGSAVISRDLIGDSRWILDKYNADGYFLTDCFARSLNMIYINQELSFYNYLR